MNTELLTPLYEISLVMRPEPLDRASFLDLTRQYLNAIRQCTPGQVPDAAAWRDWLAFLDSHPEEPAYNSYPLFPDPVFRWWVTANRALRTLHAAELGYERSIRVLFLTEPIYHWFRLVARAAGSLWITYEAPLSWDPDQSTRGPVPCVYTALRRQMLACDQTLTAQSLPLPLQEEILQLHLATGMDAQAIARKIDRRPADVGLALYQAHLRASAGQAVAA